MSVEEQEPVGGIDYDHFSRDADYIASVTRTDVGEEFLDIMRPYLDQVHQMGNRTENETEELKWVIRMTTSAYLARHPPRGSNMIGYKRKLFVGDDKRPLTDEEIKDIVGIEQIALTKATLGRDMAQQEIIKTMTQVQRREDISDEEDGSAKRDARSLFGL